MAETLESTLHAYLDGALTGAALKAFEKRLAEPKVAARLAHLKALRAALSDAAPVPSANQSKAMWNAIRAQALANAQAAGTVKASEPWYAFLTKPWTRGFSIGLVGAGAAVAVVLLLQPAKQLPPLSEAPALVAPASPSSAGAAVAQERAEAAPSQAMAAKAAVAPEAYAMKKSSLADSAAEPAPAPAMKEEMLAAAPAAAKGPTEVERALADNQVDDLIDAFLQARRSQAAAPSLGVAPTRRAANAFNANGGNASLAAYGEAPTASAQLDAADPAVLSGPRSRVDRDGFWDWHPAAVALNKRDWRQAQAELQFAVGRASEPVERAFAASALTLLSAPGGPLEGSQSGLPATGDLRVLGAGRWQLQVDGRLARFSEGIGARLPGFRVEGDSLLLDLTFDRATFSPGTRFTRVVGETPAKVLDADSQAVDSDQFSAPSGAVYNLHERELRLR